MKILFLLKEWFRGKYSRHVQIAGVFVLFGAVALIHCRFFLKYMDHLGKYDWDYIFFVYQYHLISLFSFRQIPFWNPYTSGGMPFLGRPDITFFSPFFLFISAFGVMAGLRLAVLAYLFFGMIGMFYLNRYFGVRGLPAVVSAIIFSMSGCLTLHITVGHLGWLSVMYLPYAFLFYLKGIKKLRNTCVCAVFLSLMIFDGMYMAVFSSLFMGIFATMYAMQKKTLRPVWTLMIAFGFMVLLSGPKLFPMIELMRQFPRMAGSQPWFISLKDACSVFLYRGQYDNPIVHLNYYLGWWEFGCYIGLIPVILFLTSFRLIRQHWPLILTAVLLFFLGLGNFSDFSPWALLHMAPVFNNMHISSRIFSVFVFALALLAGMSLQFFAVPKRYAYLKTAGLVLIFFMIVWDLATVNSRVFFRSLARTRLVDTGFRPEPFRQLYMPEIYNTVYSSTTSLFPQILNNRGIVNAYESIPVKNNAVPYMTKGYRGEFFLLNRRGQVSERLWSPNRLVFYYKIWRSDVLIINQNYDRNWRVRSAQKIVPYKGLLSVNLEPGQGQVELYYFPFSFVFGLLAAVAGIALFLWGIRKGIEWPAREGFDFEPKA